MSDNKKMYFPITPEKFKEMVDNGEINLKDMTKKTDASEEEKKPSFIEKAKSFAKSMISRGIDDKKCNQKTKELRMLSCHGDPSKNIPPCPKRKGSTKFQDSFYCGACGCGDKKMTQLINIMVDGKETYSKLDYPTVQCPLKMPGFSNYKINDYNSRKKMIEKDLSLEYVIENSK